MRAYDLIYKKREGQSLSEEDIRYLIQGYSKGDIPDYQMAAWAMAVFFQGMNLEETAQLTKAMAESGEIVDLSTIKGIKVDKHSTGGVGDKTTLVLAPLVSAYGIPVAKMSGRGLGHTGGTIDKLEAIPGFKTELSKTEFVNNVNKLGLSIIGQTKNISPADKKLYALRDLTATVESIPLIASSIMSKKIAGGANKIILDVKIGEGAFMKDIVSARLLAKTMVDIGRKLGRETRALITDMNQPLGNTVGNGLELKETVDTLKGKGPKDLEELSLSLGANILNLAGKCKGIKEGYQHLNNLLNSGKALEQFEKMVIHQGGKADFIDNLDLLPKAKYILTVKSDKCGYINKIKTRELGLIAMATGAGREKKGDKIDHATGIVLKKKLGDRVDKNELLCELHLNDKKGVKSLVEKLTKSFIISQEKPELNKLIYETIS